MSVTLFSENFSSFSLGVFPYDSEHSAMGEYHYIENPGYAGNWYDPVVSYRYRGPSWIITLPFLSTQHCIEQTRVEIPAEKIALPTLVTGNSLWQDYTVRVVLRALSKEQPCGFLFRYQTSLMHYGIFLTKTGIELVRVTKLERITLAACTFNWDSDNFYKLEVNVCGSHITACIEGEKILECCDSTYESGCIALCAAMPTQYQSVAVTATNEEHIRLQDVATQKQAQLKIKQATHAQPILWKKINLENFGAGRQLRFGHLTGTDELFFVICQHQRRVFKDRYPFISCMTAVSIQTGRVLWQLGEPSDSADVIQLTTDLPFQIYDIDNDGTDEVIAALDFKLTILDGKTGRVKKEILLPENLDPPEDLCGVEFGQHAFKRLNADALRIVNVSGKKRPADILIKDRYSRLWIYDDNLNFLWKFSHNNTGHFPYAYDFNGDGKDEIFSCYNMLDSRGNLVWKLPIDIDHTDEILAGPLNPKSEREQMAIVSGWEGFMLLDFDGTILLRDINGHAQRVSAGNFCPKLSGYEICVTTFWENQGIIYLYDCTGKELWHREQPCNGNLITPVNWDGSGLDLILLNANPENGGLIDGSGDVVVCFPNDGHPDLCVEIFDITGDNREEIIVWNKHELWIYAQDREKAPGLPPYNPKKYASYNGSNYRGEFSF